MKISQTSGPFSQQQKNKTTRYFCFGLDNVFSTEYPRLFLSNSNYYASARTKYTLSKLDLNFNLLYSKYLTETNNSGMPIEDIRLNSDNSGNLYVSATSGLAASTISRYFIKINNTGDIEWQKGILGTAIANLTHPEIDSNGDVYVMASYNGSFDFQLYKFSPQGTILLNKTYGLSNASFHPIALRFVLDSSNNIYGIGQRYSPIQGSIFKLDSSGNPQWFRYTPGAYQMVEIKIVGSYIYTFGTGTDGFVLYKFDLNGNFIKSVKVLINGSDANQIVSQNFGSRMTILNNEHVVIATRGPGGGVSYSAYIAKLDLNLNLVSQKEVLVYSANSPNISGCIALNNKLIYQSQDATNYRYGLFAIEMNSDILNYGNKIIKNNIVRAYNSATTTTVHGNFSIIDGTLMSVTEFTPTINTDLSLTSSNGVTGFSSSNLLDAALPTNTSYSYRID